MRVSEARLGAAGATMAVLAFLALMGSGIVGADSAALPDGSALNTRARAIALSPKPAAPIHLRLFDGRPFRLDEQRGRIVVLNFWASWCEPCRQEIPALEAIHRRGEDVTVVGLNLWDRDDDARAFLDALGATYANGVDVDGSSAIDYGVRGIPETFFVDRAGRLTHRWIGPLTEPALDEILAELAG